MIKGVLFDFDGTLTVPGALDFPAIKRMLGCPLDDPILEFIALQPPDRRPGLMKILEEQEDLAAEASVPNRGAENCLHLLKKRKMPLGILTRSRLKPITRSLGRFREITIDHFAVIITREMSLPKPHPDGVIQAAERMGLLPGELVVVGDFSFDVISGRRAGAVTVLLTNGGVSVMASDDPEPDYIIDHLEELPDLLSCHSREAAILGR